MKKIEALIEVSCIDDVKRALAIVGIEGLTLTEVNEAASEHAHVQHYRGGGMLVDVKPKMKIEVLLDDFKAPQIIEAIRKAARNGHDGDGRICVLPVDDVVRIRTSERGRDAI